MLGCWKHTVNSQMHGHGWRYKSTWQRHVKGPRIDKCCPARSPSRGFQGARSSGPKHYSRRYQGHYELYGLVRPRISGPLHTEIWQWFRLNSTEARARLGLIDFRSIFTCVVHQANGDRSIKRSLHHSDWWSSTPKFRLHEVSMFSSTATHHIY